MSRCIHSLDDLIGATLQPDFVGTQDSENVASLSNTEAGNASPCLENITFDGEGFAAIVSELSKTQTELAKIRRWQAEMEARLASQGIFMNAQTETDGGLAALGKKDPIGTNASAHSLSDSVRWYWFDKSVYDALFFMLTEHVGMVNSMWILVAFIVNVMLTLGLILVLDASFTEDPLPDISLERLKEWRRSEAHAYYNADPMTGVSLSARVCIMDEGLSFSTSQVELYKDATHYLDWGFFMGNIAMILWSITCASKLRKSLQFIWALSNLPRTTGNSRFVASDSVAVFEIVALSIQRLLIGCLVAVCQSLMAVLLLLYGSWWLAYTISVFDLLLNASALSFIFEIDRMIFSVFLPLSVDGLLTSVRPLRLPNATKEFRIPFALAIGISLFVTGINLTFMQHIETQVRLAEKILCSESSNLDFIIGTNTAGFSVYATSVPSHAPVSARMAARQKVTQLLIDRDPEADSYVKEVSAATADGNLALVQSAAGTDFVDVVKDYDCVDFSGAKLGGHLWLVTGNSSNKSVTACEQVSSYCRGAANSTLAKHVRLICPVTCGCADPTSGLWDLASPSAGCPWGQCKAPFRDLLDTYECQDTPLQELQTNSSFSSMLRRMHTSGAINTSVFNNLTSEGCKGFQHFDYWKRQSLCGTYDLFSLHPDATIEFGAGVLCPESCNCYYDDHNTDFGIGEAPQYSPGLPAICPLKTCLIRWQAPGKDQESEVDEEESEEKKEGEGEEEEEESNDQASEVDEGESEEKKEGEGEEEEEESNWWEKWR